MICLHFSPSPFYAYFLGTAPLSFPVESLGESQIVDTNGAGDAFVGGFLAQMAKGEGLDARVRCGIWAATTIIQRSGCSCPEKMDFQ